MQKISQQTRMITAMGMLLAMVAVISFLEYQLPPLPPPFPTGMRFGLSNVIVMYTLFFLGYRAGFTMAVLKSFFVFLMRGADAAFISLCGGLVSMTVLVLLLICFRSHISYLLLSIAGAVSHNIGQMLAFSLQMSTTAGFLLLPLLIISGILLGIVTGITLGIIMPIFDRILGLKRDAPAHYKKP